MTARQCRFVVEYLANGGNGKQAAIKAGYSPHTADRQASRLLRKAEVAEAVAHQERAAKKLEVTLDSIVAEMRGIAFAPLPEDERLKVRDELRALETLVRILGLSREKTTSDGGPTLEDLILRSMALPTK